MTDIAVIINQQAQNAQNASNYLESFEAAGISYQVYEIEPNHLELIIKQCQDTYPLILVGGGDGTIRTAAQQCAHTSTVLGILPLGTLNHFAKELGLPQTPEEMIAAIQQRSTQLIDLAEVNGNMFINNSSIGFYTKFARHRDLYSKNYNKWLSYIPSLIDSIRSHKVFNFTIKNKEFQRELRTSFLMISNNLYTYEFPITIKRESFQKAQLGLYFFKYGRLSIRKMMGKLFNKQNNFEVHSSTHPIELVFKNNDLVTISLDGDTMKVESPLVYRSVPQSLTILMKPQ